MERQIVDTYVKTGKAKFVFRHFAFLGPESFSAAEASECAADQGKFWEYHNMLYDNQTGENIGAFSDDRLKSFATRLGLDRAKFDACLASHQHRPDVDRSIELGKSLGIPGTPTVFVVDAQGNRKVVQHADNFTEIQQLVDAALASAGAAGPTPTAGQ